MITDKEVNVEVNGIMYGAFLTGSNCVFPGPNMLSVRRIPKPNHKGGGQLKDGSKAHNAVRAALGL